MSKIYLHRSRKEVALPLNDIAIRRAQPRDKDWKLFDEKGLYLLVTRAGGKRWHFKYRINDKENKLSLGSYPEISLKSARAKRDEARTMIANGVDPAATKRATKVAAKVASENTFGSIARELIERRTLGDLRPATLKKDRWHLTLLRDSLDILPVTEVDVPKVFSVLGEFERKGKLETAKKLRGFIGRVMEFAVSTGRAQFNPASSLRSVLLKPKPTSHPAIVDRARLGQLLRAIEGYSGYPSTQLALRISPHLFQRPGEIRTMRWADLDLGQASWRLPAQSMKMRREHVVPLSRQSLVIINEAAALRGVGEFVFPAFHSAKRPLSENSVNAALKRLGFAGEMTAHGFRSTASSLLNESGKWHPDVIEHALAHKGTDAIRAIYNRATYWDERVAMHAWWSNELDAIRNTGS